MLAAAGNILRCIGHLVWPETCAGCGANDHTHEGFCEECSRELLSLVSLDYCPRCGRTVGPGLGADADGCWACPPVMPRFGKMVRVGPYASPLRQAIRRMKYHHGQYPGERLVGLLAEVVTARCEADRLDLVAAVPMHWLRRLSRGWNHSSILASGVAARLGIVADEALIRVRNTPPQVRLPASKRAANVRGAFAARDAGSIRGAHVLLVDDVLTTGATANEASRALLAAGAKHVTVAVLAKGEPPTAHSHL